MCFEDRPTLLVVVIAGLRPRLVMLFQDHIALSWMKEPGFPASSSIQSGCVSPKLHLKFGKRAGVKYTKIIGGGEDTTDPPLAFET